MYYRYTGGYKPYLLDIIFDVCELMERTAEILGNAFLRLFVVATSKIFQDLFKGCPYTGRLESGWIDGNDTFSRLLPPIVPAGRYKFYHRLFWQKKNETIVIIEYQVDVKPRKEFRDMGKGYLYCLKFNNF